MPLLNIPTAWCESYRRFKTIGGLGVVMESVMRTHSSDASVLITSCQIFLNCIYACIDSEDIKAAKKHLILYLFYKKK